MNIEQYIANVPEGFREFAEQIRQDSPTVVHSVSVIGSVLTPDFKKDFSDINSLIVVEEKSLEFFDFIIELGHKFRDQRVAPPLVMTPEYIRNSLDVFPMEFFNFSAIHHTLFGEDILEGLEIDTALLRLQCEREIKAKLLWLGQVYMECLGDQKLLAEKLAASITGYIPLFRSILHLATGDIILDSDSIIRLLEQETGISTESFTLVNDRKNGIEKFKGKEDLYACFTCYYGATEKVSGYVDQLSE